MPALYRQYRPNSFSEITGQDHITSILEKEILQDKVAHAYLFQGPRGTGKTTTARVFAKRLNCSKAKKTEACGKCPSCVAFDRKASLDLIEIDAASNRGIDDIRALRETANLAPAHGKYKVYIIDEVHMLSGPAFAALLKTLEEPPKHVIFILATTELHKVPATIASRCQLFRFKRATDEDMRARLTYILTQEQRTASDEVLSFIIARSDGCYRDAESLLGQLLSHSEKNISIAGASELLGVPSPEIVEKFLESLVRGNAQEAVGIATQAYTQGFDPEQFIQECVRTARDGIVRNITQDTPPAFAAGNNAIDRITVIMRAFLVALQDMAYVPEPMIALELAILTSCVGTKPQAPVQPAPVLQQLKKVAQVTAQEPAKVAQEQPTQAVPVSAGDTDLLKKIQSSWENIIQSLRADKPVASTFLRATQPKEVVGNVLVLQVQFPLHKTFFEKPENILVVQGALQPVIGKDLTIKCVMGTPTVVAPSQEQDLLKNVQEVFGIKVG